MYNEYFKSQIDEGATEMFFYAIEREGNLTIQRHRGTLKSFPTNLRFSRMMGSTPFFTLEEE